MGARIQFEPTDDATFLAGFFNASPADPNAEDPQRDNRRGTDFRFGDGLLMILEGHFKYDIGLPGTVKLGGWRQCNNDYRDFVTDEVVDGSNGVYAIIDQQVWKGRGNESINVFGHISRSPDRQNLEDFYADVGIVFTGLVPGRGNDSFGAAFAYGDISSRFIQRQLIDGAAVLSDYEALLEINYTAELMTGWTITPDFQYVWNPGGRVEDPNRPGQVLGDVMAIGLRTNLTF
jgi:porin